MPVLGLAVGREAIEAPPRHTTQDQQRRGQQAGQCRAVGLGAHNMPGPAVTRAAGRAVPCSGSGAHNTPGPAVTRAAGRAVPCSGSGAHNTPGPAVARAVGRAAVPTVDRPTLSVVCRRPGVLGAACSVFLVAGLTRHRAGGAGNDRRCSGQSRAAGTVC